MFRSGSGYYQYLTSTTAQNYLKHSSPITVVRIMGADYSHASATISSSIDPAVVGGGSAHTGSITLTSGEYGGDEGDGTLLTSASLTPFGGLPTT